MRRFRGAVLLGSCLLSACSFGRAVKHATVDGPADRDATDLQMTGGSTTSMSEDPMVVDATTPVTYGSSSPTGGAAKALTGVERSSPTTRQQRTGASSTSSTNTSVSTSGTIASQS